MSSAAARRTTPERDLLARLWWAGLLRGTTALALGAYIASQTPSSSAAVARTSAAYWIVDGLVTMWAGASIATLTLNRLVLLLPAASALAIFAWWAVVIGLFEAGESLASGSRRVLVSVLSLALGLFVLAGPVHDPSLLLLAVALYGVLAGAGRLHAARSRRLR